jgi:uncharacterized pyridoxamine 5'-phosphate oxidase family protein
MHGQVAYLATTRNDGAPRVHPVTPIIGGGHLFIFMEPTSPKAYDLRRDPRFALHNGVRDTSGEGGEVSLSGTARLVTDTDLRTVAVQHTPYEPAERYVLFVCTPERVMVSTYGADGVHRQRWQRPE